MLPEKTILPELLLCLQDRSPQSCPCPSAVSHAGCQLEKPQGHAEEQGSPGAPAQVLAGCLKARGCERRAWVQFTLVSEGTPQCKHCLLAQNLPSSNCSWELTPNNYQQMTCREQQIDLLICFNFWRPIWIQWLSLQQQGDPENKWALLQKGSKSVTTVTLTHTPKCTHAQHPLKEALTSTPPYENWVASLLCFVLLLRTTWNKWRKNQQPRKSLTLYRLQLTSPDRDPACFLTLHQWTSRQYWKWKAALLQYISKRLLNTSLTFKAQQEPREPPNILTSEQCKLDISSYPPPRNTTVLFYFVEFTTLEVSPLIHCTS